MAQPFFTNPFIGLQNYGQSYLASLQQQNQQTQQPSPMPQLQQQQQQQQQSHHHQSLSERVRQMSEVTAPMSNPMLSQMNGQRRMDSVQETQAFPMGKDFMQQQVQQFQQSPPQQQTTPTPPLVTHKSSETSNIRNVWVENFEIELPIISELLDKFPYVAMDTEFPGVVIDEISEAFRNSDQREYLKIKANVDILKIIQVGITLSDENGNLPEPVSTWQFNFNFDIDTENKSTTSINLLQNCGIDFQKLKRHGIHPLYFAEKVITSGLILNDRVHWICFHGCYDFAYLLKIVMNELLPKSKENFNQNLKMLFPNIYDIKSFQHEFSDLFESGGLNRIADLLGIQRIGITHQAGSDSLVTSQVFFKLRSNFQNLFPQIILEYNHDVYGFSNDQAFPSMSRTPATIHHIDPLHSNTFDENDNAVNHELYYNYVPNSDYDGGFFYNGLGSGTTNNVDLSVFQSRSTPVVQSSFQNYINSQQYVDSGKKLGKNIQDIFVEQSYAKTQASGHLLHTTTPPPLMMEGQYILRNLTPGQNHGVDLINQYSQQQWNYYNGTNNHQNGYPNSTGTFYS
ncbi:caf1-domain-containing protein [Stylonychia lemnae]|uniref:poly(A)-specific ribonuclease n=1 Tax=Stylonychia lemnae TaxID=5949 RepID=A0A078AHT9_STYLE|nr:caf1-domain-containing protein [Stylonychia lemnae]|eukprot:CDW81835.1 caf1-domain-containing protein [Stylonychia lemnae]